jgi:hypothetical protein
LEIGLIICPPTSFSDYRTGASEKIRSTPPKTFFNSIGHERPIGDGRIMSAVTPKATKSLHRTK